jgi:hypothetical protein
MLARSLQIVIASDSVMLHVVHITKCQKEQLYLCSPCGRLRLALGSVIVPTLLYAAWFACEIAFYCDVSF